MSFCFGWRKRRQRGWLRRNIFTIQAPSPAALGVRTWGSSMTDSERKERRDQVERFRVLRQETTALLLHDIVLELEAELVGDPSTLASLRKQSVLKSD